MSKILLQKRTAYIGCIGVVGIISLEFGVVGILPQIASYYHLNIRDAGYLLSAFALTIALTAPFSVLFASRFNRKKTMLLALGLFFLSSVLSVLAPPFWLMVLLRMLPAFLHPVFFSMAIETASEGGSRRMQLRYTSIIIGGVTLAQVTVLPLGTFMASVFDWRAVYIVQCVILLIGLLSIYFLIPSTPPKEPKHYSSQLAILKKPAFIAGTFFNFLLILSWFATYGYFADYLTKIKGLGTKEVSYMLLLFGATGLLSNFVAGRMLGRKPVITTLFFLSGIFLLPLLLAYTDSSLTQVFAAVAIWGAMFGSCFLIGVYYGISAAPEARAFANSLQISFGNLGVSLGTAISGWFIVKHSVSVTPWVGFGTGISALVVLLWRVYLDASQSEKNSQVLSHR
ncbi:MFS transporter [Chitinophaga ginsengisegetis]|uniref:MFS transporter n=1 Tax=Chitinophaga ginsengisegetis TaxID=393003 RepID=UPI003431D490